MFAILFRRADESVEDSDEEEEDGREVSAVAHAATGASAPKAVKAGKSEQTAAPAAGKGKKGKKQPEPEREEEESEEEEDQELFDPAELSKYDDALVRMIQMRQEQRTGKKGARYFVHNELYFLREICRIRVHLYYLFVLFFFLCHFLSVFFVSL